ncbi:hypothetical protein FF38_10909 [Lucilia cuprina]|uniref:Uncharacterized protein n=1 Tax=Lucilia cuprina TaxID=7375 RepID=A0A0L0C5M8_LUCCU|nr:hypothetical protein FF38_10909 [Lucilia cuprina]
MVKGSKFLISASIRFIKSCVVALDYFIYSKLIGLQKAMDTGVEFFQISSKLVDGESSAYFRIFNGTSDVINTLLYSEDDSLVWSEEKSDAILKAVFSSRAPSPITAFRSVISIGDDIMLFFFSFILSYDVSETSSLDKVSSEVDNLFPFDFELKSSYCLQGAPTVDTQIATSTHTEHSSVLYQLIL